MCAFAQVVTPVRILFKCLGYLHIVQKVHVHMLIHREVVALNGIIPIEGNVQFALQQWVACISRGKT